MSLPILATKLYASSARPEWVLRPRLIQRLVEGLERGHQLTLVPAPAGFGKTTLLSEWVAGCGRPVAWLSLDTGDNDPARFLAYFVAALQTVEADIGGGVMAALHSPKPLSMEAGLTALINELTTISEPFVLVLDDYHLITAQPIQAGLAYLLDHLFGYQGIFIATAISNGAMGALGFYWFRRRFFPDAAAPSMG